MVTEIDIRLADGRTLHAYDTRADGNGSSPGTPGSPAVVFWLHGSPNVGSPPEPLFAAAEANELRWVSYDRPGYGGSSACDGRTTASAAGDLAAVADALGIGRFAVLGHSGGGPHALACAALLPERVIAAVSVSAPAPFDATGLDWYAGWSPGIAAENRAAAGGRAALEDHWATAQPEDMGAFFTEADIARQPKCARSRTSATSPCSTAFQRRWPGSPPASVREPAGRGRGIKSPQFVLIPLL